MKEQSNRHRSISPMSSASMVIISAIYIYIQLQTAAVMLCESVCKYMYTYIRVCIFVRFAGWPWSPHSHTQFLRPTTVKSVAHIARTTHYPPTFVVVVVVAPCVLKRTALASYSSQRVSYLSYLPTTGTPRRTLMATHFWSFLALFQCVVINAALRDVGSNFKSYICVYIVAVTAHSFELAIRWSALNLKILWRSHAFALVFDRQSGKTCIHMQYEPDYRSVKLI